MIVGDMFLIIVNFAFLNIKGCNSTATWSQIFILKKRAKVDVLLQVDTFLLSTTLFTINGFTQVAVTQPLKA